MSITALYELAALANWGICSAIGLLCLDQLNSCRCRENAWDRARYAMLLGGATASGLQPVLFRSWPAWADVAMSAAVLAGLLINAWRWRRKERLEGLA
jgi:hypothetical protein